MKKEKWLDKPYNNLNSALRERFGSKVIKLSVDGGFSCPNRDGRLGLGGCLFCSEKGSGDFAGDATSSIRQQLDQQISLLKNKWPDGIYIAYFQSFSNTYGDIHYMESQFREALSYPGVVGIAIATRVDCLSEKVLDLLETLSQETYMWIEMGLQSIYESHHKFLNTGYKPEQFRWAVCQLADRHIDVVGHIILGLPHTPENAVNETIEYLNALPLAGIKIHMLNILKGTALGDLYEGEPFPLLTMEAYLGAVCHILEGLRPDIVIHRVTGDGAKDSLIAPRWILNKRKVLNTLMKLFKERNSYQGKYLK